VVDELADSNRSGTTCAETQEEKEEVEILNGRFVHEASPVSGPRSPARANSLVQLPLEIGENRVTTASDFMALLADRCP
jgi:hypothetical protein